MSDIEEENMRDNINNDDGGGEESVSSLNIDGDNDVPPDAGEVSASSNIDDDNEASGIDEESSSSNVDDDNDEASGIDEEEPADTDGGSGVEPLDSITGSADDENAAVDDGVDAHRIFEALIFASNEMLTPAKLKTLVPGAPDAKRLRKMSAEINERLESEGHPFEIVEAGGGYQFRTLALYHPWVRKLHKERSEKKLSLQALECLAIIAYRQPISKAEVEAVRGVLSDGAMKTLLERKLVDICGRSEKPGRPLLYSTTNDFLRYFGINKVTDLPRIEEFEALAKAKMEEMSTEELGNRESGSESRDDSEEKT